MCRTYVSTASIECGKGESVSKRLGFGRKRLGFGRKRLGVSPRARNLYRPIPCGRGNAGPRTRLTHRHVGTEAAHGSVFTCPLGFRTPRVSRGLR